MNHLLEQGFKVLTTLGQQVVVREFLGGGGQGEVYRVDYNGREMALKWYSAAGQGRNPNAFYESIKKNVNKSPSTQFLWPIDITEWKNNSFGYIMGLRPDGYQEFTQFLKCNCCFRNYKVMVDAALNLVSAFRILHNKGYSYQDLNDGNFFINPQDGDVLICDNDNVAEDGTNTGIVGKPRYIAPEVIKGLNMPNTYSDLFSMAIILFMIFTNCHPLEGKRAAGVRNEAKNLMLFGFEPVFVMDPDNTSNRPIPGTHDNVIELWPLFPSYLRGIFEKAFSKDSIENPHRRPNEYEWMECLVRFRSDIVKCSCGNEVFTEDCKMTQCDSCRARIAIPATLQLRYAGYQIPATIGTRIYRCQTMVCNPENALIPVGGVIKHPGDRTKVGLYNYGRETWRVTTPSGKKITNEQNTIVPVKDRLTISVNDSEIFIHKR